MTVVHTGGMATGTAAKGGTGEATALPFSLPESTAAPKRLSHGKSSTKVARAEHAAPSRSKEPPSGAFHVLLGALFAPAEGESVRIGHRPSSGAAEDHRTSSVGSTAAQAPSRGQNPELNASDVAPVLRQKPTPSLPVASTGDTSRAAAPVEEDGFPTVHIPHLVHRSVAERLVDLPRGATRPEAEADPSLEAHAPAIQDTVARPAQTDETNPAHSRSDLPIASPELLPNSHSSQVAVSAGQWSSAETATPSLHDAPPVRTGMHSPAVSVSEARPSERVVTTANTPSVTGDARASAMQHSGNVTVAVTGPGGTPAPSVQAVTPEVLPASPSPAPTLPQATANAVVVHVEPPGVGPVTVSVSVRGSEVAARLNTANSAFGTVLRSGASTVASALETHGLVLGRWSVGGDGAGTAGGGQGGAQYQSGQNTPFPTPERRVEWWRPPPQGMAGARPSTPANEIGHIDQWL